MLYVIKLATEGDLIAIVGASMKIMQESRIFEIDFDINNIKCSTVYARELMEDNGMYDN